MHENLPGLREADLTAICGPIVENMLSPRRLTTLTVISVFYCQAPSLENRHVWPIDVTGP
jgi:hypothetical protein